MSSIETRDRFFQSNKERLEQMAFKYQEQGLALNEFITLAIDVDDPKLSDLVEDLMPGQDWQAIRNRGEKPVARGALLVEDFVDYLCQVCPDIAPALKCELPPGFARAVVLADGATVYYIKPSPPQR